MKNCTILSPKTPQNDLLTFNWGHPSSCNTLSTWRTTNVHFGHLLKLNARWALPVYPVLKDQSHWKMCEHIRKKNTAPQYNSNSLNCKKDRAPIQSNSWIVKNRRAIIAGWEDEGGYYKNHDVPNNSRCRFAAIKHTNRWAQSVLKWLIDQLNSCC